MHRILSYQTAVRVNDDRDIGEYVSKRTCVSLVLSIAFFTLISGFLLGKFVTDRQQQLKKFTQVDVEILREMQTIRTAAYPNYHIIKNSLTETQNSSIHLIYNKYIFCLQKDIPTVLVDVSTLFHEFVEFSLQRTLDCLRDIIAKPNQIE